MRERLSAAASNVTDRFTRGLKTLRDWDFTDWLGRILGVGAWEDVQKQIEGESFFVFTVDNPFRRGCARVVRHVYFEFYILVVVVFSCVALGFDSPSSREDSKVALMLDIMTYITLASFTIEWILKMIGFGAFMGQHAYFQNHWHKLEFLILIANGIGIAFSEARAFQCVRIFRLANKWESIRVVTTSLVMAIPGLANVVMLMLFFYVIFGIVGVQFFKGKWVACSDASPTSARTASATSPPHRHCSSTTRQAGS